LSSDREKALLTLSRKLRELNDFGALPTILHETIDRFVPIDWLGLYTSSSQGTAYSATTNPHLPFNWDQLYQEISSYDNFRERAMSLRVGQALIYEEMRDPHNEKERHTNTSHLMTTPFIKDSEVFAGVGFFRIELQQGFAQKDTATYNKPWPFYQDEFPN
jgi:hypothetical protein